MDKNQLKEIIKPLIKECVKEVMLESGILSKIVSEVAIGLHGTMITESRIVEPKINKIEPKQVNKSLNKEQSEERSKILQEKQQAFDKIAQATGISQVFSNLKPNFEPKTTIIQEEVQVQPQSNKINLELTKEEQAELLEEQRKIKKQEQEDAKHGHRGGTALRGVDPNDPGIPIGGILNVIGGKKTWGNLLNRLK